MKHEVSARCRASRNVKQSTPEPGSADSSSDELSRGVDFVSSVSESERTESESESREDSSD